jgi:hypothetical protein
MDGLRWSRDLLANSFPELKPVVHSYPIQLRPAVGNDELHRACLKKFSNEALVKVPNASTVQCTLLVPEFSERQFRDYSLVGFQSVCLPSIVQNLSRFGSSAFHERAGECQVCFSFFFFISCKDVFVLLFLPVSSCP